MCSGRKREERKKKKKRRRKKKERKKELVRVPTDNRNQRKQGTNITA